MSLNANKIAKETKEAISKKKVTRFRKLFRDYVKDPAAANSEPPDNKVKIKSGSSNKSTSLSPSVSISKGKSDTAKGRRRRNFKDVENIADAKELAKADEEEFENAQVHVAVSKIRNKSLQWKVEENQKTKKDVKKTSKGGAASAKGKAAAVEESSKSNAQKKMKSPKDEDVPDIDQNSADYKTALRLMQLLKRNNFLENALFPAQNDTLRAFFEGGMKDPDKKVFELLSKAFEFVLEAIFFRGEDLDTFIDGELKALCLNTGKAKAMMLDVMLSRHEFLPQSWGGRVVMLKDDANLDLGQKGEKK